MAFGVGFNYGGGYNNYGNGGFAPSRYNQGQYQQNSTDIYTGGGNNFWRQRGHFFNQGTAGYGINLNQRPGHQRGQDGVLVFDQNHDGKYGKSDVSFSNDLMKSATGDFDFNNDGKTSFIEKLRGKALRQQFAKMDENHDGRLDSREMSKAGGKVWIDSDRKGDVDRNEMHSVYNVPGQDAWGREGSQRLDFVDPFSQTSHTSPNRPWYGGGYPGNCGCGGGWSGGWGGGYPGFPSFGGGGFGGGGGGWGGGMQLF